MQNVSSPKIQTYQSSDSFSLNDLNSDAYPKDTKLFCCKCIYKRRATPLTCLAICFIVLIYSLLGGNIFLETESPVIEESSMRFPKSNTPQNNAASTQNELLQSLTGNLINVSATVLMDLQKCQSNIFKCENVSLNYTDKNYHTTFARSFLYAITLMMAIGMYK